MSLCAKCRQTPPQNNDSWCLGCTGVQTLSTELSGSWKIPGFRAAAEDVIVSAVRGVKALRELATSCHSAGQSRAALTRADTPGPAGTTSNAKAPEKERPRLPSPPPPPPKVEEESDESETEEEDIEEEEKVEGAAPKAGPATRPPEPDHPPRGYHPHHRSRDQQRPRGHSRSREKRRSHRDHHKSRGSRAGSKHPRTYRVLENPELRAHRKPPSQFWTQDRPLAGLGPHSGRR